MEGRRKVKRGPKENEEKKQEKKRGRWYDRSWKTLAHMA